MRIFTDFHHSALMRSLVILFEHRLGHKVYRPIGTEWAEEGFWKVYDHPATVQQYLTLAQGYRPIDGTPPLNDFVKDIKDPEPDVYYCADPESESYNKAITLDKFKSMKFDIIIASIPAHIEPFLELIRLYQPHAKLILQVGNNWLWEEMPARNILASTYPKPYPPDFHVMFYHQEFDTSIFYPSAVPGQMKITSLVNLLPQYGGDEFNAMERLLPSHTFRSYGAGCRDGIKNGVKEVAEAIHESDWVFHVKRGGDGFGHVIHNAFACGRPVITRKSHYEKCLAGDLMIHMETCIDLDVVSYEEAAAIITSGGTELAKVMGENAYRLFVEKVNFEREAKEIEQWLKNLK